MDIKAYIASGILELYAMDQLSPPEREEVERHVVQYPELRAELEEIEFGLEMFAQAQASPLPSNLLAGIHGKIDALDPPASTSSTHRSADTANNPWWKWAAIIMGLGLFTLAYFLYSFNQSYQSQIDELQQQLADCEVQTNRLDSLGRELAFFSDPNSNFIELAGLPNHSDAQASVVHNTSDGRTLFSTAGLPPIAADQQYQLWAIVDGATISLGVFDAPDAGDNAMVEVPFELNAGAFAVTLEPRGGSIDPTMDQMYVLGETG